MTEFRPTTMIARKTVEQWEVPGGKRFDTREKALRHVREQELRKLFDTDERGISLFALADAWDKLKSLMIDFDRETRL